ncbi:SDR family NAD(P)-dependent oxidoreductase [Chachezhania antarctica]|uniref:SDR family NAD(P)-dependent oxidoreductase n=1 Tax=Chachezhania antarctica TaxID=2340860 RepID=UPI000EB3150A|nr:SDR family NAD(P)-dependent oxidoreductase [Chachezhania antarctica]
MTGSPAALIVGAGQGLSAALARRLAARDYRLILAARDPSDLADLAAETGATTIACDAGDRTDTARLFAEVDAVGLPLELAIYNPSARVRGPIETLDAEAAEKAMMVTSYGAFLMAHFAAQRMVPRGKGNIFFTGASAGVKGFANSTVFAMGKFGLRGLAQALARELQPKGIHVAHFVIDGGIAKADTPNEDESRLDPGAIADSYLALLDQPRSAWTWEIELRPWTEPF